MSKLKCTNVSKQAWNDERITLEGDDMTVTINLKNPKDHGKFVKDKTYDVPLSGKKK